MRDKTKSNTQIELLFSAYKIGGLPFAMFILGSIILLGGILDGFINLIPNVDSSSLLFVSVIILLFGVIVWYLEAFLKNRVQLSIINVMDNLIIGASEVSKTGGDYQSAVRDVIPEFPKILESLNYTKEIE